MIEKVVVKIPMAARHATTMFSMGHGMVAPAPQVRCVLLRCYNLALIAGLEDGTLVQVLQGK